MYYTSQKPKYILKINKILKLESAIMYNMDIKWYFINSHQDFKILEQGLKPFPVKVDTKYFGSLGHTVPVATTQLCHCSSKVAKDSAEIKLCPNKLY